MMTPQGPVPLPWCAAQVEGVQFMYSCVMGLRENGLGCILVSRQQGRRTCSLPALPGQPSHEHTWHLKSQGVPQGAWR